jgi:hypothetical protein
MRKLVLGIIALVAVQFAFVTYMMVLQPPVDVARTETRHDPVRTDAVNGPAEAEPLESPELPESDAAAPIAEPTHTRQISVASNASNAHQRVAKPVRPSTRRVARPAFDAAPSRPAGPEEFRSVVISYNRKPSASDCEAPAVPATTAPAKRADVAKTVPVFKKPWKWIKALGSKLY